MLPSTIRNTSIFAATGFGVGTLFGTSSSDDFEHLDALERMSEHSVSKQKLFVE
ncbi:hypothetical protein [Acinetobacter wanghuae]|uniref:Uncharacterized protein n=1 Tax=Acinetobacter wanghuae TaxID=2662362 RepID=A0AA90W1T7_9GAMM|nr:hypothetical protein [Acinetobacter wanghuae]MQW90972.1 hypothetical protein [Acinetobacter wanghuae]